MHLIYILYLRSSFLSQLRIQKIWRRQDKELLMLITQTRMQSQKTILTRNFHKGNLKLSLTLFDSL